MVTRPVIDNSADTITLNRANVVLFRQLFKQFKNEKMLNMEFCMMHLRIHLIPTNKVAKVLFKETDIISVKDCDKTKEKFRKEYCYSSFAKKSSDTSLCNSIEEDYLKESCIAQVEKNNMTDWKIYSKEGVSFTFKYPQDWEIIREYFYKTTVGIKAMNPTIELQKIGEVDFINRIIINESQLRCDLGTCKEVDRIVIGTLSRDTKVLEILNKIADSFKRIE